MVDTKVRSGGSGIGSTTSRPMSNVSPSIQGSASNLVDVNNQSPKASTILIGMIALLVILKLAGDAGKLGITNPSHIHIGGYNLLTVTVTAIVGIALTKLLFNRFHVPGITPLVNFI